MTQTVPCRPLAFRAHYLLLATLASLLSLVASAQTFTTKSSGNFLNPAIWVGGVAPGKVIPAGATVNVKHAVTFDLFEDITLSGTLNITGDTLRFPTAFTKRLTVTTTGRLTVVNGGFIQNTAERQCELNVEGGYLKFENARVLIGKAFRATNGGRRMMKNSTIIIGEGYLADGSSSAFVHDTLSNTSLYVSVAGGGPFEIKDEAELVAANAKVLIGDGDFKVSSNSSISLLASATNYYAFTVIKTNKNLDNDGTWDARVDAYCVDGDVKGNRLSDIDLTRPEDCTLTPSQATLGQMVMNEVYTDPGVGKHEFLELYNVSTHPESLDNYTLVTYFESYLEKGFYTLDFPDMTVAPRGFFVAAASLPFSFQTLSNTNLANFSWNSLTSGTNGSLRKWVRSSDNNESDGNRYYNLSPLPALGLNDLFTRLTGDVAYSFFLYKNGILVNQIIAGSGGLKEVSLSVTSMPRLNVDMAGSSPDFSIAFSSYKNLPVEAINQDAGSDNGFIRSIDGGCGSWKKSSSGATHTPLQPNSTETLTLTNGSVTVSSTITRGTATAGSIVNYKVTAAASDALPAELRVYADNGLVPGQYDMNDALITIKNATAVGESFSTNFTPFDADILIVVKQVAGCVDNIVLSKQPFISILPVSFLGFTATHANGAANLRWNVIEKDGFSHFVVERSTNGRDFSNISIVFSGGAAVTEYDYKDRGADATAPVVYYRIKGVDVSGATTVSAVRIVRPNKDSRNLEVTIYPNPARDVIRITVPSAWQGKRLAVELVSATGNVVRTLQFATASQTESISVNELAKGLYVARFTSEGQVLQQRILKN